MPGPERLTTKLPTQLQNTNVESYSCPKTRKIETKENTSTFNLKVSENMREEELKMI